MLQLGVTSVFNLFQTGTFDFAWVRTVMVRYRYPSVAIACKDTGYSTQTSGMAQELHAHTRTERTPMRIASSMLFTTVPAANTYSRMLTAIESQSPNLATPNWPGRERSTSGGCVYSNTRVGYMAGAPRASKTDRTGRWDESSEISARLWPRPPKRGGIRASATDALAMVDLRFSFVCSRIHSSRAPQVS